MPATLNGIGTRYVGRKNALLRPDTCRHCGRLGQLSSYDTTEYFVVLFVPLVPLSKKHVIDECPSCTRHFAVPGAKWAQIQGENRGKAEALLRERPDDWRAAVEAHGLLEGIQLRDDADALATALEKKFGHVAEVRLQLGDVLDLRGSSGEARAHYAAAHAIDPTMGAAREALAFYAARDGESDVAFEYLRPVLAARTMRSAVAGRMVAKRLVEEGRAEEAHPILLALLEAFPALTSDKSFAKELRTCEKARGGARTPLRTDHATKIRIALIAGSFGMLGALFLLLDAYAAAHRTLYVVNGEGASVEVEIPGAGRVDLRSAVTSQLELPQGTYTALVTGDVTREISFTLESARWPRFLDDSVYVLDATGRSVLCVEHATYTVKGDDGDDGVRVIYGKDFSRIPDIDYAFEPFPRVIQLSSNGSHEQRTRISLVEGSIEEIVYRLLDRQDVRQAFELAEWGLKCDPRSPSMLRTFTDAAVGARSVARASALLAPRLEERPVDLELHAAWLGLQPLDAQGRLVAEYEARREKDPREGAWPWLQARLSTRVSERLVLLEQATYDPRVAPHVWRDLAATQASAGNWAEAQSAARRALDSEVDGYAAGGLVFDSMAALGMGDELLSGLDAILETYPCNWDAVMRRLELVPKDAPQSAMAQHLAAWEMRAGRACPSSARELGFTMHLHAAWLRNDLVGLEKLVAARKDPELEHWMLTSLAERGATELLQQRLWKRTGPIDPYTALAIAVACRAHGDKGQAEEWEALAVATMQETRVNAEVKGILDGKRKEPAKLALDLALDPWEKSVLLAFLSFPKKNERAQLLEMSLMLQPRPLFPRRVVERLALEAGLR